MSSTAGGVAYLPDTFYLIDSTDGYHEEKRSELVLG